VADGVAKGGVAVCRMERYGKEVGGEERSVRNDG